jgi:two-component system, NtrC family, response regulator AtoC
MKVHQRILILDDEQALRSIIAQRLGRRGYEIIEAGTAQEGMALLQENLFEAILLDIRLPDGDGLHLLPQIKKLQPDLQVIMLTGHGTLESAIEAMKAGAFDYLTKPCNLSELEITLQKAIEQRTLLIENTGLRQVVHRQNPELQIVGESAIIQSLKDLTRKIAQTDAPVLLQGESGTGKELFARALHVWSERSSQAYVPLNSGAIPEALMESELFGYEKGAFTGASSGKIGLVEMADRGTLFLDEIGEMPIALQVKLLRFLETGEFRRVGDTRLRRVDVRIVTATNRNLLKEVEIGRFRQDLYYRLNGLVIHIPALRERKEDIIPLAEYFLKSGRAARGKEEIKLSEEAQHALYAYNFPGNVRELAHLIERGKILSEGTTITPKDLWPEHKQVQEIPNDGIFNYSRGLLKNSNYPTLAEIEKEHILITLKRVDGNRAQAAKLLGISVRNLYRKIEEYEKQSR